ncbi:hypothetical protein BSL78_19929 [Apostichopus japonicus]|uniref:Reverse transcriptase domain-containing protein n=1 Tax=Stichopus japonicus TaxID=307972 RepID=A0A2G8K5G4_STIJA|nr:hypothetical protein BSL78_19929 [Apostichopus japonicus]
MKRQVACSHRARLRHLQIHELDISDRIGKSVETPAYITLKDHKDDFTSRPTCRLINPSKSEMGRVSKHMLDRINTSLRKRLQVNQWRSTPAVLEWFSALKDKAHLTFMIFDIVDFYPSITKELLSKSLTWARQYTPIQDTVYATIMHARKSLLYDLEGRPWVKKATTDAFDVTMGGFDGAEVCELVGYYILHKLGDLIDSHDIGLYRDDGLAVLRDHSGSQADRMRKRIVAAFHTFGLKITTQANIKTVNYLDATLDLRTGTHRPFRKPNDQPTYVHCLSNHPRKSPSVFQRASATGSPLFHLTKRSLTTLPPYTTMRSEIAATPTT